MNQQVYEKLLYLTGILLNKLPVDSKRLEGIQLEDLYKVAHAHSLTNLSYEALIYANIILPDTETIKKWKEEHDKAITKSILMDEERKVICDWLNQNEIWYMPLKGSILQEYYPKKGMREMSDNDILFDKKYRKTVRNWFVKRGYFVKVYNANCEDVYLKQPVYNFEMHVALFSTVFREENKDFVEYYQNVKERLVQDSFAPYLYHFTNEDFYIYFIAHAFKHYSGGGTGIRTLIDEYLYLNNHEKTMDWDYLHKELESLNIAEFEEITRSLAQAIFKNPNAFSIQTLNPSQQEQLKYYLNSGVYGTIQQKVKNQLGEFSNSSDISFISKVKYVYNRLIPSHSVMQFWCAVYAPFFTRHKWLMPLAIPWRFFTRGLTNLKKWINELRIVNKS